MSVADECNVLLVLIEFPVSLKLLNCNKFFLKEGFQNWAKITCVYILYIDTYIVFYIIYCILANVYMFV